ncbi:hypothetical protein [Streptomyces sp. NPDC094032]|uniref:hypothetical protein n=1 Tax=Streptomyces sp. NPDC094032 TaxID=3155308 RepID=UPI00331B7D2F
MKRTIVLSLAGAVVLAGSATAAVLATQDDDVTVHAICLPVDETDGDKAGIVDHVAVVTVDQTVKEQPNDVNVEIFSMVRVDKTLKGTLPSGATVDQVVFRVPGGGIKATGPHRAPLTAGHRYVIGIDDWGSTTSPRLREVYFSTPADGAQLGKERTRWKTAVAHQTAKRIAPSCNDVVNVP